MKKKNAVKISMTLFYFTLVLFCASVLIFKFVTVDQYETVIGRFETSGNQTYFQYYHLSKSASKGTAQKKILLKDASTGATLEGTELEEISQHIKLPEGEVSLFKVTLKDVPENYVDGQDYSLSILVGKTEVLKLLVNGI